MCRKTFKEQKLTCDTTVMARSMFAHGLYFSIVLLLKKKISKEIAGGEKANSSTQLAKKLSKYRKYGYFLQPFCSVCTAGYGKDFSRKSRGSSGEKPKQKDKNPEEFCVLESQKTH